MSEFKVLRVTVQEDYIIEMYDDKRTKINGWTIKEVIKDWFKGSRMLGFHASRDTHRISGTRKYISSEVVDLNEHGDRI